MKNIQFLPINRAASPPETRKRRGYRSCDHCRTKKVRCEPTLDDDGNPTCRKCQAESQICRITHVRKKRKLHAPTLVGSSRKNQLAGGSHSPREIETSSAQTSAAYESQMDTQNQVTGSSVSGHEELSRPGVHPDGTNLRHVQPNASERIRTTQLLNASDVLDLLTFAAADEQVRDRDMETNIAGSRESAGKITSGNDSGHPTISSTATWETFLLVKRGILQPYEVAEYFDFYFRQLWPLLPVVPRFYNDQAQYLPLVLGEPVLAMSLVALASRYHDLSGMSGTVRSERIHWRTWPWVQKYLQSTMWGSSCMRRLGSIASLLLFIEWHCRPLNSPNDFIGDMDDLEIAESEEAPVTLRLGLPDTRFSNLTPRQRSATTPLLEKLKIIAPAYRSNKMSWILLSTAIALAEEMGCFDDDSHLYMSTSSANERDQAVKAEWSRLLCIYIRLMDEHLAVRLGFDPLLPQDERHDIYDRFPPGLIEGEHWESVWDLAMITSKARVILQGIRRDGLSPRQNDLIAPLERLKRGLDRWQIQHTIDPANDVSLRSACLLLEYHYARLYCFSTAAQVNTKVDKQDIERSQVLDKFASEAIEACISTLNIIVGTFPSTSLLKYVGVRYWLYIVCATLFLLKTTLSAEEHVADSHEHIRLIRAGAAAIRQNAPDDIHMSQRYATFIEVVTEAALRPSSARNQDARQPDYGTIEDLQFGDLGTFGSLGLNGSDDWTVNLDFWESITGIPGLGIN